MPFAIQCPYCLQTLTIPDQLAGLTVTCPVCGVSILIPFSPGFAVQEPVHVAAPPFITVPVRETTLATRRHSRSRARRSDFRRFAWALGLVAVIGGASWGYFVWKPQGPNGKGPRTATANASSVETMLGRQGYHDTHCLICGQERSANARKMHSDDRGFGFCERCGVGQRTAVHVGAKGAYATDKEKQLVVEFMQRCHDGLGPNPSEMRRSIVLAAMSSFDSPEWNSLFGPLKPKVNQPTLITPPPAATVPPLARKYRSRRLWDDFKARLAETGLQGISEELVGLRNDEALRYASYPDDLVIFRQSIAIGVTYSASQSEKVGALLVTTIGINVGTKEATRIIEMQSEAMRSPGRTITGDVGNMKCIASCDGFRISTLLFFLDEVEEFKAKSSR